MTIELINGNFHINGYVIAGSYESDYEVYSEEDFENDGECLYYNTSFEHCLVWCMNS